MSMFNTGDILETIEMFTQDNLDVRTVTMGIACWTASTRTRKRPVRRSTIKS